MTMLHVEYFPVHWMVEWFLGIIVFPQIQFRIGGGLKCCSLKSSLMNEP